jgi:hypothetical protein
MRSRIYTNPGSADMLPRIAVRIADAMLRFVGPKPTRPQANGFAAVSRETVRLDAIVFGW